MVQSINTIAEFTAKANSFHGGLNAQFGNIMIGDKGFEFFNEKNLLDFVQIPWEEVDYVTAQVFFKGKIIRSFIITTKKNGNFKFTAKESGRVLKFMSQHLEKNQLLKARGLFRKLQVFIENRRK